MTLETGDGITVASPTLQQVEDALRSLDGSPEPFVILTRPDGSFIQAAGTPSGGFVLEHSPSHGPLRQTANSSLALSTVVRAVGAFMNGAEEPMRGLSVQSVFASDPAPAKNRRRRWSLWVLGAAAIAYVVARLTHGEEESMQVLLIGGALAFASMVWDGLRLGAVHGTRGEMYDLESRPVGFAIVSLLYAALALLFLIILFTYR